MTFPDVMSNGTKQENLSQEKQRLDFNSFRKEKNEITESQISEEIIAQQDNLFNDQLFDDNYRETENLNVEESWLDNSNNQSHSKN